ncbi:MAG: GTPase HflX, partial [Desulfatitalea sp.]
ISAHNPEHIETLRNKILQLFEANTVQTTMLIPYDKGHLLGQLRTKASITNEAYSETGTEVTFKTFPETLAWLQRMLA